ncbi:MAG: hypothetical protein ACOZNI_19155 [Myxococcota bacterium]
MLALHDHLVQLGAHSRAVAWTFRLMSGHSANAFSREYVLFAPPNTAGSQAVLSRLHNAVILANPASAEVDAPVGPDRLEPLLGRLRQIHHIELRLKGEGRAPVVDGYDLPSLDVASHGPPGPGLAAGLDIGGTGMKACVLRPDGTLLRVASAPTWPDGEHGIASLVRRARELVQRVAAGEPLGSLGIGFASPMGVGGKVLELSTVMREKVGDPSAFDAFPRAVAQGLVDGPVAIFNDLANLGRTLSAQGVRRLVRLQIGTSFGGCWIDANGLVYATEMGRVVIDAGPDAVPHPYLPIAGAVRAYLSNRGVADDLAVRLGRPVDLREAGKVLRALLEQGDPVGEQALDRMAQALRAVVLELHAVLPGVTGVELGGSMLQGPGGKGLLARVTGPAAPWATPVEVRIAAQPGHDGAIAAALAPRVDTALKAMRRVG